MEDNTGKYEDLSLLDRFKTIMLKPWSTRVVKDKYIPPGSPNTYNKQLEAYWAQLRHESLVKGLAAGSGAFALSFLAMQALDQLHSIKRKKHSEKLKSLARAQYPVFSPDMSLKDTKDEAKEENIGLKDTQSLEPELEKVSEKGVSEVDGELNTMGIRGPAWGPAFWALMIASGLSLGTLSGKKFVAARKGKKLDKEISTSKNRIDKLFTEEYMRTRDITKDDVKDIIEEQKEANEKLILFDRIKNQHYALNEDGNKKEIKDLNKYLGNFIFRNNVGGALSKEAAGPTPYREEVDKRSGGGVGSYYTYGLFSAYLAYAALSYAMGVRLGAAAVKSTLPEYKRLSAIEQLAKNQTMLSSPPVLIEDPTPNANTKAIFSQGKKKKEDELAVTNSSKSTLFE